MRISYIRLRGFRSINVVCLIVSSVCVIFLLSLLFLIYIIQTIVIYNNYIQSHSFSTVPFWKDTRPGNKNSPLPVMEIADVNLSNATIVVTSCCRNVRENLDGFQKNVRKIVALFGDYRIYLGESDSHDQTLQFLYQWQKNDSNHVRIHSKGQQRWTIFARTVRIASCRNTLLEQARREWRSFDYYFVLDVDVGSSSSFDVKDFLSNFLYSPSSWLAMTATQRSEYYDIWALRIESILPFDCWQHIKQLTSFFIDRTFLTNHLIKIHQKAIPRNVSLIEVQSAFGGAALYNGRYLRRECSYDGRNEGGSWWIYEQCEHVPFHQCIQQYAKEQKIFVNPQFQIC